MNQGPYCRSCGAKLVQGRKAGHSGLDGEPFYIFTCPNDRWWKVLVFHSMWLQGRYFR